MPASSLSRIAEDAALGLLVGAATLVTASQPDFDARGADGPHHDRDGRGHGPPVEVDWVQRGAVAALVVALAFRRTAPRVSYLGVLVAVAVFLQGGGPYGPVLLGPALSAHTLMTRLPPRQWLPLLAAVPLTMSAGFWSHPRAGLTETGLYLAVVLGTAGVVLPGLVALVVVGRREAQRQDLVAERRRHAYEERLQIAREVHDVVGHSLAVINLQAGVALHVLQKRPEQLAPSLEAIRSTSKTALAELSGTLATFRGDLGADAGAPGGAAPAPDGSPAPGRLAGLDGLVSALQAAGRTVRFSRPPQDRLHLPVAVEHAALRIAQEGLTNVVRHASPDASVTVAVTLEGPDLVVEVVDDGTAPARPVVEGSGLTGIRERARAVGGTVTLGPRPGAGFGIRAVLPLDGSAAR